MSKLANVVWFRPMKLLIVTLLLAASGCSHDAKPAQVASGDQPLPPSSGTPIGYLIDDASELKLKDDQLSKLKDIDATLAARIEVIDSQIKGKSTASTEPAPDPRGGGHRGHGGGMGGHGSNRTHPVRPPTSASGTADDVARLTAERAADVRDALHQAIEVFDPGQQELAKKVLSDHGVDLDASGTATEPAGGASER